MTPCAACPRLVPRGVALCFACLLVLPAVDRRALLEDLRADTWTTRNAGGSPVAVAWRERTGLAAAAIALAVKTVGAIREDLARRASRAA